MTLPGNTFLRALRSARENRGAYRIAAIDVHKKMLAVVVADVAGEGEYEFERRKYGAADDRRSGSRGSGYPIGEGLVFMGGSVSGGRKERRRNKGVRYEERRPAVSAKSKRTRAARMIKEVRNLGYRVEGGPLPAGDPA